MSLMSISAGKDVPNDVNVIIEIPAMAEPVKYEVDKDSGALWVDRFMGTAMHYPANYGFIPQTLGDDGDPVDVLVVTPIPLKHGSVIRCRPIGVLDMSDESGRDEKLIAVPVSKLTPIYNNVQEATDLPQLLLDQIKHFFEHYKDLEPGKWVKVERWGNAEDARKTIQAGVENYNKK
ncbi:MAG: inorganic diphosphatase [Gammaproteobacteria bacterium]|nr:inorganic diphosphatase [Gammaproteobacteria bacterium]MDH5692680.1 inorganic diphosphatase [Gammaproteobacteria bacterium]